MEPTGRGEKSAVAAASLAAGLLVAQQVAGRTTRDALFLSIFGAESLPAIMMASAVVALLGAEAMSISLARRSPSRVMPLAAGLSAVLLVLEWLLSLLAPAATAVVLYVHIAAFGGALVSGFWSLVNERFDPYTARQIVGKVGTGAAAGGLVGGGLAWAASRVLANPTALLMLGALHGLAVLALLWARGRGERPVARERAPALALPLITRVPYLRTLALVVGLSALVDALLDYLFKAKTAELFTGPGEMMQVFALFHVAVSLLGLVVQWALARPLLGRLGLVGTVSVRPVIDVATSLLGAVMPRFATATAARSGHETLTHSLFRSGYELLYTPLPEVEKRRVKAVVDVAVDKAGTLLGGATIAATLALWPAGSEPRLFAFAAVISLCVVWLSRRLHRGYVRALEQSLLSGRVRLAPDDVVDRTTELTLARSGVIDRGTLLEQIAASRKTLDRPPDADAPPSGLASASPPPAPRGAALADDLEALLSGRVAQIQRVLRENPDPGPALVAGMIPLLSRNDLYPRVVRTLRKVAPRATGQLVDALLDPQVDPVVRRRIPRVLKACPSPRASAGLQDALDDASLGVRAAAAAGLAALCQAVPELAPSRAAAFARVREELGRPPGGERQLAHLFTLLSLAIPPEPLRIAWAALRGADRALRGTALEYLATVLPDDVFASLCDRCGGATAPSGPRRSVDQVAADLRASAAGLRLERPPWRRGDDEGETSGH